MTKRHALGEPARFAAKADDRYFVRLEPLIGVALHDVIVEELPDATWSTLFAYCFRRFGPPNRGSDDYKEIARWMITTPMPGLVLSVRIAPTPVWIIFNAYVERHMFEDVIAARNAHDEEYRARFVAWNQRTHGDEPPGWTTKVDEYARMTPEERDSRSQALEARWNEYRKSVPKEEQEPPLPPLLAQAEAAVRRTLRDLTRAVRVRDQGIDASGVVDRMSAPSAKPYVHAGRWTPHYMMGPEMDPIHAAVHRLGGGIEAMRRLGAIVDAIPDSHKRRKHKAIDQDGPDE